MTERVNVCLGERSYPILIERGAALDGRIVSELIRERGGAVASCVIAGADPHSTIVVVTDETVYGLYGFDFLQSLARAGIKATPVLITPGEESKTLATFGMLMDAFAAAGLSRKGLVVALGGGVVGDIAGFAAASWKRGVAYAQIPTTLLAMVDSSVGGKTAVDIPAGKNLVGAFHQPSFVVVDPDLLNTLPEREYKSGMAEVIKYGAIASVTLFEELERMAEGMACADMVEGNGSLRMDETLAGGLIAECIRAKADVVSEDEFDTGRRMILNFGHTFGHAIEACYGFSKYTHGEGVGMGMRIAARYGETAGITETGTARRLGALLDAFGLTDDLTGELTDKGTDEVYAELVSYMRNDKKAHGDMVDLVLLKRIGEAVVAPTPFAELVL